MLTSSAKAKGRRLVQKVRDALLAESPDLTPADIFLPVSSQPGEDLPMSPRARTRFPFTFEMKNQEAVNIWKAFEQADSHSVGTPYKPVLVIARNKTEPLVVMKLEHWVKEVT